MIFAVLAADQLVDDHKKANNVDIQTITPSDTNITGESSGKLVIFKEAKVMLRASNQCCERFNYKSYNKNNLATFPSSKSWCVGYAIARGWFF